jgi:hypothetical protein
MNWTRGTDSPLSAPHPSHMEVGFTCWPILFSPRRSQELRRPDRGPAMRAGRLRLALGLKDLRLGLEAGEKARTPMPFASMLRDNLLEAVAQGDGTRHWAALARSCSAPCGGSRRLSAAA